MSSLKLLLSFLVLEALLTCQYLTLATAANSKLFREYIGAQFNNVKFSDVPINPNVEFHFILSFAIDYDTSNSPSPTDGKFNVFWDSGNLGPAQVAAIKKQRPNVKVALSLGGDTVKDRFAFFQPSSIASWRANALSSLTQIINTYHLDGIDVDYEHFKADPETFASCVGWVIQQLKNKKVISFASIAPFDDNEVQNHYLALWRSFGSFIDYVNFQFYAYDKGTTVSQFLNFFNTQSSRYTGAKILTSFSTEAHAGGLLPTNGFFTAVNILKKQQNLHGIFVWSADDSKGNGFEHEVQSQRILASGN